MFASQKKAQGLRPPGSFGYHSPFVTYRVTYLLFETVKKAAKSKSGREDLNLRPPGPESDHVGLLNLVEFGSF
jgi:hypothetical protein